MLWVRPPFVVVVVCVHTYLHTDIQTYIHKFATSYVLYLPGCSLLTSLIPWGRRYTHFVILLKKFVLLEFLRCGCGRLPIPRGPPAPSSLWFVPVNKSHFQLLPRRLRPYLQVWVRLGCSSPAFWSESSQVNELARIQLQEQSRALHYIARYSPLRHLFYLITCENDGKNEY